MLHFQQYPYLLPTQTFSAGNTVTQPLRDLPKTLFGRICHVVAFQFDAVFTPTFTVAPDVRGANNLLVQCDLWDGQINRFQGGFNQMRAKERMQSGRIRVPDADTTTASASPRAFSRVLHLGPPQFLGHPSDFAVPTGMLENGELRMKWGAIADVQGAGTASAATGTVKITARLILLDEIRIPPVYQFYNQQVSAQDFNISGRCAYESIAIAPSNLQSGGSTAFANGAIGNVTLDLGNGNILNGTPRETLTTLVADDFSVGEVGGIQGDALSAADGRFKQVNKGTPTALTTGDLDLQMVLHSPPDARISKLWTAESVARLRWDGSATSALLLISRILPQNAQVVAANAQRALGRLPLSIKGIGVKTLSKGQYSGPMGEYMPWKVSVG